MPTAHFNIMRAHDESREALARAKSTKWAKITFNNPEIIMVAPENSRPCKDERLSQALQMLAKAEKKTKRRWVSGWRRANFIKAAELYNEAAVLFSQSDRHDKAKQALLEAAECFKRKRAWFCAAKTLEQAIKIATQEQDLADGLPDMALNAACVFEKAGQPDSAAYLLERVAKTLEDRDVPADCERLLEKAAIIVETENRPIQAAYYTNKVLQMKLQNDDLSEAVVKARKMVSLYQVLICS